MKTRLLPRRRLGRLLTLFLLLGLPAVPPAEAQFIPYYGKNKVKYDNFAWRVYKSPHFEVYYYPEFEQHLARLVSYLESAYLKLSTGLKHELSHPVPAILYKTHSEFEQTNLYPSFVPEGVLAFAEPLRGRLVLPIDEAPDRLMGLIQHEMTHVFAFDLIPRTLVQRDIPLWIDEGLADYFRGMWDDLDLMMVRDAAVTDQVPKLSRAQFEAFSGRLVYNLGHACFEYMESRYGKEGIRQFLYTLRKGILGGNIEEIFKQAFRTTPEEVRPGLRQVAEGALQAVPRQGASERLRPGDLPEPREDRLHPGLRLRAQPFGGDGGRHHRRPVQRQGDHRAAVLEGRPGDQPPHSGVPRPVREPVHLRGVRGRAVDRLRPEGRRGGLFRPREQGTHLVPGFGPRRPDPAEHPGEPGSPAGSLPPARRAPRPLRRPAGGCLRHLDARPGDEEGGEPDQGRVRGRGSPDLPRREAGRLQPPHQRTRQDLLVPPRRTRTQKTQLTFGAFDDDAPIFSSDGKKIYYASNEDDDIPNLRGLDLETGVIKQYTDVLGGNMAPAPLKGGKLGDRLAFISYFKNEYKLQTKDLLEPLKEVEQEVQPAAEGLVDFQPDVAHQVVPENKRRKRLFEGLYLEGRPPINVGVTSSGDFFGGSAIGLTDVLGDHNFTFTALSIREFRTYEGTYINLAKRLHYGITGFDTTAFFYASPTASRPASSAKGRSPPSATAAPSSSPNTRSTSSAASSCRPG